MKNLKFFAGLMTLLCCFHSGVCLTSFADGAYNPGLPTEEPTEEALVIPWEEISEEFKTSINTVRDEVQKFIDEQKLSLVQCDVAYGRSETLSYIWVYTDNSDVAFNQLKAVKAYCQKQGFTEQYLFSFDVLVPEEGAYNPELPTEEPTKETPVTSWELSEEFKTGINAVRAEVQKFIDEQKLSLVCSEVTFGRTEELSYISVMTDNTSGAGAGELTLVKTYCEEQGFTEQYTFKFENLVAVLELENPIEEMQTEFEAGDVTLDGLVDILDVITVNKAVLGKEILSTIQNKLADINHDGKVDSSDALEILKQVVGLTE